MNRNTTAATLRTQDANNRALRTFLQGLGIDVLVALSLVLITVFNDASEWEELQWSLLGFTLLKTLLLTVASYVMRRFMDSSGLPTPLPPEDPGPPADEADSPYPPEAHRP